MSAGEIDNLLLRQRAIASIPSKFETVLHEGGKEKDAFWSRTHRFKYQDDEMPGPGTYALKLAPGNVPAIFWHGVRCSLLRTAERFAPSYSKKGYTGISSIEMMLFSLLF
jgi:hypothetical protein